MSYPRRDPHDLPYLERVERENRRMLVVGVISLVVSLALLLFCGGGGRCCT